MSSVIEARRLSIDYDTEHGPVRAVDNVSFTVARSERLVLLGPSGCGKSTILKSIAGFIRPSSGDILVEGRAVTKPGPDRLVVFQEFDQLLPWKTVRDNVAFPLKVARGKSGAEARALAEAALAKVGLARVIKDYPHTLSGGMKQRAAIARALAASPEVLLMDEPFGALDAQTRLSMQALLLSLWDRRRSTVLFVTHDVDEALILADVVYVMSAAPGRIIRRIDVDTPRPRAVDRLDQAFLDRRAHIIGLLRQQHVTDIT